MKTIVFILDEGVTEKANFSSWSIDSQGRPFSYVRWSSGHSAIIYQKDEGSIWKFV